MIWNECQEDDCGLPDGHDGEHRSYAELAEPHLNPPANWFRRELRRVPRGDGEDDK